MSLVNFYTSFHDPLWVLILSAVLFFPVRQLIWVLYVRKKQKTKGEVTDDDKIRLKKRANFTSVLLCIVFSYLYVIQVFN